MLTPRNKTLRRLAEAGHWFAAVIGRAGVLRSFAVGLVSGLLAAMGAWPTPGLFGDHESRRPERKPPLNPARLLSSSWKRRSKEERSL
jgi:hypothetical protein